MIERLRMRILVLAVLSIAGLCIAGLAPTAPARAASTWDQVAGAGTLRVGVIPDRPPYIYKTSTTGDWQGFSIEMAKDMARALSVAMDKEIKPEFVITSWPTVVLDIEANKIDVFFGFNFSEERRRAIDLFGPLYAVPSVVVTAKGFNPGENWSDFDKPDIKLSVAMGTTDEAAAKRFLPHATLRAMKGMAETVLDVQSGNAQALVTTVLTGMGTMKESPNLANVVIPKPLYAAPSGGGTRKDGDGRFTAFAQGFCWSYRESGRSQKVIVEAMQKLGMDVSKLPAGLTF